MRAIVGPGTKLTYAADWSEYSGLSAGDGRATSSSTSIRCGRRDDIDAVGIDNYMPLADWRDGDRPCRCGGCGSGRMTSTICAANIAGGEGFDWYYASDADRLAQDAHADHRRRAMASRGCVGSRTSRAGGAMRITTGRAGCASATPTAWVPESKPIWFTELGCGAVDKGANQPNVFGDPKSAESGRPYFSSGAPDALMQRQFLRAHLGYWASRPTIRRAWSMLERIYLLDLGCAALSGVSGRCATSGRDGANHATGHWLTGRLGGAGER